MQTNQTQPFTYIVGWTTHNIYYVGVRYAKGCSPEDLGTTYFTSSKVIKPLWAKEEPDFKCIYPFETREEALAFEETLQREFDVLNSKQFANKHIRGESFSVYGSRGPLSDIHREKLSAAKSGKKKSTAHRQKISEALKENTNSKGKLCKPVSNETREKISKARKEYWANRRKQK